MDYQGLTIQFNGDASGLLATLRQIDVVTTSTQRSLSQVTKALKLDPSSAALYASQGRLIREDLKDRQDSLFKLTGSYDDYSKKLRDANVQQEKVNRQLSNARNHYRDATDDLKRWEQGYANAQSQLQGFFNERRTLMGQRSDYLAKQNTLEARQAELLKQTTNENEVYVRSFKKRANLTGSQKSARQAAYYNQQLKQTNAALAENSTKLADNTTRLQAAKTGMDRASKSVKTQYEQMQRVRGEQKRYGSEVKNLTEQQNDLNKKTKLYTAEIKDLKDKAAIAKAEIKCLGEEMSRLDVANWLNTTNSGRFFASLGAGGSALSGVGDKLINLGARATATEAVLLGMFGRQVLSEAEEYGNAISQVGGYLELSGSKLEEMSDLALYWGKETQFSATEAAEAMSELAKGGMTDAQIKGGALEATMQLAAAGGISMADAATVAVNAIKVFDLSSEDATDVADALAGAANKSTAEIGSLASAFRYVSGWAGLADYSINDVAGALGLLADHGLQAEMAGTGLRNFMQRLGAPTGKAKELLEQYGVEVYDASGKMKGLADLVDELNKAFGDLDDATRNETLNTIFGARALPTAIALMGAGREELEEYIGATEREGYALEMMKARMGDLGWALEYLRGEFETAQVNLGKAFTPIAIEVANAIEKMLSAFNSLDEAGQKDVANTLIKIAMAGPGLLALGAAMKVVGGSMVGISRIAVAIRTLGTETGTLGLALANLSGGALSAGGAVAALAGGLAAVAAIIGVAAFAKYRYDQYKTQRRTEQFEHSTRGLIETLDDIHTGTAIHNLELFSESVRTTTGDIDDMVEAQSEMVDAISERNADAQSSIDELERARRIVLLYGTSVDDLTQQQLGDLEWALGVVNDALGTNYQYNSDLKQIYGEEGESIEGLIGHIDDLILAKEREIQAEAIQDNMRDIYQSQSKWMAKRAELQEKYREQTEKVAEAERKMREAEANRDWSGGEGDQAYAAAQREYAEAVEEQGRLRDEIIETNTEIHNNSVALEEYANQLAAVMEDDLDNAQKLSKAFDILSSTGDEVGDHIGEFLQKLVDIPDDGIESIDDLSSALADAGFNMESLSHLTQDELAEMLESSTDVQDFIDKLVEWSDVHATPEVDVESNTHDVVKDLQWLSRVKALRKKGSVQIGGNLSETIIAIKNYKATTLVGKTGRAIVDGNLHQATNDLKEWNRLGMESKWGKATIAVAIQSKGVKSGGLADGGMLYRHADGYITNHSIYSGSHVIGEAGIEAVLPLNNRAATQPLVDAIADGVSRRVGDGNQYNLYINDARVNDDPAIRAAFLNLMGAVNRKGMMVNAAR